MLPILSGGFINLDQYVTLPQNLLLSPGTLIEDFENDADWTPDGAGGSLTADAINFKTGTQSMKLTTAVGGVKGAFRTVDWNMSNCGFISVWIYMYGTAADFSHIDIDFYNDAAQNDGFRRNLTSNWSSVNVPGWNRFDITPELWWWDLVMGTGTWANQIIRLRFWVYAAGGKTAIASFDNLTYGRKSMPAVMFWFSDGLLTAYTDAYPIMAAHNIRGVLPPITDDINQANHCTTAQMITLQNAGWIVCNGTRDHPVLNTLTEAQQEAEWTDAIAALIANGLSKYNYYAETPWGYDTLNADSFTAFANVGLLTVLDGSARNDWRPMIMPAPPPLLGVIPEIDLYGAIGTHTLAQCTTMIDRAIVDGTILNLLTEGIWSMADFTSLVEYVASKKNQINVITIDDYYKLTLGPVRVPKMK